MELADISFSEVFARGTYGLLIFSLVIFSFALVFLWVLLPFVVFRVKNILNDTNYQLARISQTLGRIEKALQDQTVSNTTQKNADQPTDFDSVMDSVLLTKNESSIPLKSDNGSSCPKKSPKNDLPAFKPPNSEE